MNEEKNLSEILKGESEAHNMSAAKLAEASGVPERYVAALMNGEFSLLPPAPYIRGYLVRISSILGAQGEEWWQRYKKEVALQSSGPLDRLPSNRFAIQSFNKKWVALGLISFSLIGYLALHLPSILGQPMLHLSSYDDDRIFTVASPLVTLAGSIKPGDKLTLNNEAAYVDPQGNFTKEILLQKGLNTVELLVSRFLGGEKKIVKQFMFEPENKPGTQTQP